MIAPGGYHTCNYNGVILARPRPLRKGKARKSGRTLPSRIPWGTLADAMPAHLRPPERTKTRLLGALALAIGLGVTVAVLVLAASGGDGGDEPTTRLVQPATDVSTEPTVLGTVIKRTTTLPPGAPASPATFTTQGAGDPRRATSSPTAGRRAGTTTPPPTLAPPVSITAPPRTTTTTAPTTTSTSEAPTTTTTESTTTTDTTPP